MTHERGIRVICQVICSITFVARNASNPTDNEDENNIMRHEYDDASNCCHQLTRRRRAVAEAGGTYYWTLGVSALRAR